MPARSGMAAIKDGMHQSRQGAENQKSCFAGLLRRQRRTPEKCQYIQWRLIAAPRSWMNFALSHRKAIWTVG
jgi:hypothetical protein